MNDDRLLGPPPAVRADPDIEVLNYFIIMIIDKKDDIIETTALHDIIKNVWNATKY